MTDIHNTLEDITLEARDEAWRAKRRTARRIVRACAEHEQWPWEDITLVEKMLDLKERP